MNKLTTLCLFAMCILTACEENTTKQPHASHKIDEVRETQAIMEVIKQETDCFFAKNFHCWQETYAHTDGVSQSLTMPDGSLATKKGWKELSEGVQTMMQNSDWGEQKIERRNITIKFNDSNTARLAWDQYIGDLRTQKYIYSKDSRIMEKIDGKWRITNVTALWDYKKPIPFKEFTLNE